MIQDEQEQKKYQSVWLARGKADTGPAQLDNRPGKGVEKASKSESLCIFY